jgi:hypothetical protein
MPFPFTVKTAAAIRHVQFEDLGAFETVLGSKAYHIQHGNMRIGDLRGSASLECNFFVSIGAYEEQKSPLSQPELLLADSHVPE